MARIIETSTSPLWGDDAVRLGKSHGAHAEEAVVAQTMEAVAGLFNRDHQLCDIQEATYSSDSREQTPKDGIVFIGDTRINLHRPRDVRKLNGFLDPYLPGIIYRVNNNNHKR